MRTAASFQTERSGGGAGRSARCARVAGRVAAIGLLLGRRARRVGLWALARAIVAALGAAGRALGVAAGPLLLLARVVGVVGAALVGHAHVRPTIASRDDSGVTIAPESSLDVRFGGSEQAECLAGVLGHVEQRR